MNSRAPPRFNARGRGVVAGDVAQLRFVVYHGNQLLQSFVLRARIGDESAVSERRRLSIRCDFSQTRRFGGLDRLGERIFSFALNKGSDGTHSLMLKGSGGKPLAIDWTEGQMSELAGEMREQMWKALFRAPQRERFEFDPHTLGLLESPGAEFDKVVRQLATQGARLYVRFRMDSGVAGDFLRGVRAADAGTLQFVLHEPKFSFPWSLIYDYSPEVVAKSPSLPVCRGVDGSGMRCTCTPDSGSTICLRGFWGFRFVLEQLSSAPPPDENVAGFIAPCATSPTIGLARAVSDVYADTLPGLFPTPPRATSSEFTDGQPLLSLLETPKNRPAVVVWLGHQVDSGSARSPWPELRSAKNTIVLDLADIDAAVRRCEPDGWGLPRPIVLLLGCGTAAARADLGIGLAAALLRLGAIGVLGTEIEVTTSIVTRVARDLVEKLVAGQCVGDAVKETLWKLAQEGCPLGLAFTYLGRVEARLPS